MREVVPRVERVIDVPAAITLDELHEVLQVAIGWTDSHLHQFRTEDTVYTVPFEDWGEDREVDERGVRLSALSNKFVYAYDLGDNWRHDVEVLGRGDDRPGCVYGEGSCPPEDCGGVGGYADLLDALADPRHREHESMREWTGDRLKPFDQEATSQRVRDAVGAVPDSVRIVLDLVTDGVKLTPGGRLPRAVVRAVQEQRPGWNPTGRPASIEEDLLSLAVLRDLLKHVRLVRLTNGVLRPTKAAADELETVRRLRSWFDDGAFHTMIAERAVALVAARSRSRRSPPRCIRYSAMGGAAAGSPSPPGTYRTSSTPCRTSSRPSTSSPARVQNGLRDLRRARCYLGRTCSPTCSDRLPLGHQ